MKITKFLVHQVDLPQKDRGISYSHGRCYSTQDTTVVEIQTDAGISGYGEACPQGSTYLPAYPAGVRAGLKELAPQLLGEDPLEIDCLNERMDYLFKGHPYVKSPIDMACWDILGKFTKLPLFTLMGGRLTDSIPLYKIISIVSPEETINQLMAEKEQGYTKFQVKLSGKPREDIERLQQIRAALDSTNICFGDANTAYTSGEAIRVATAVKDPNVYLEQPCFTYEECLAVQRRTHCPMILDECVTDVPLLVRAHADNAAEVFALKMSSLGGMTKTKKARDLCVSLGMSIKMEDSAGSDIVTAAVAHLAHSTKEKNLFCAYAHNTLTHSIATGAPQAQYGHMQASDRPGLGIEPIMAKLGPAVFTI